MKKYIFWIAINLIVGISLPQLQAEKNVYPEAGKKCPDFILKNIRYYSKPQATLQDFKGKWLVLDFWNKYCGACVASFPKLSKLQNEFGDKVQFMLVGFQDKEQQIESMYAKFKEKENLITPCAFDSSLARHWDIYTAPYIIVIDPEGVVRSITYSVSDSDIQGFLNGISPRLPKAYRVHEQEEDTRISYDATKPILIRDNGGRDTGFVFRSVLSTFDAFTQHFSLPNRIVDDENAYKNGFQVMGAPLYWLYNYAYFGVARPDSNYRMQPVFKLKDTSLFDFSEKYSKNLFCYSLTIPQNQVTAARIQSIMQRDLQNYFGFTATIEEMSFSCWKLVALPGAKEKLKTKGGPEEFKTIIPKADFVARNWPFSEFVQFLRNFNDNDIIDETGINQNVDLQMNCILTDINQVRNGLHSLGLDLIHGEKVKKVLVIIEKE